MKIHLNSEHPKNRLPRDFLLQKIRQILKSLKLNQAVLGVSLVTDNEIKKLNRKYRSQNKPTDVLSFPMEDKVYIGDVIISLDTAKKQAKQHNKTMRDECLFLIIHGILHLIGYDHVRDDDHRKMVKKENQLLKLIGSQR